MATVIFEDPKTGKREDITWRNILAAFLLGPISMLLEGLWGAFLLWTLLTLATMALMGAGGLFLLVPIYWFGYPAFLTSMIRNKYQKRGWIEIKDGVSSLKKCPECAELVKTEATVCRFCGHKFVQAN